MPQSIGLEGKFDVSNFNAGLNQYISGLLKAQAATQTAVGALNQLGNVNIKGGFGSSLSNLASQITGLGKAGQTAGGQMTTFGQNFQQGLAQGIGQQAVKMFTDLGGAILSAGRNAFETVAFYERLGLTVQSIVADTIQAKDATLSLAQAFDLAEKPAEGVERRLEKIAILSPFTPRDVAVAFQTATAYGFTANEALRLTQALADFAAVRGLSADQMKRISLALSQIQSKGKLAAQEINQLADAGVPVRDILAKAFNLTKQQLEQMLDAGAVPANDAISAIVTSMERYDGAAKKATFTFTGLVSTLSEISELGGRDIFGGIFKPLKPLLDEFVKFATADEFSASLRVLGETVGGAVTVGVQNLTAYVSQLLAGFNALNPSIKEGVVVFGLTAIAVTGLIASIGALTLILGALTAPFIVLIGVTSALAAAWVENFGGIQQATFSALQGIASAMDSLASTAVSWGNNIIDSIAQGISSAVDLVVQALNVIGSAITYFLEPGSPPRLLPNLDKWGKGAADAYLTGWNDADFSFLDTFGNLISTKINNLAGQGKIDQQDIGERVLGGRLAFTDAIEQLRQFGSVSDATISQIAKTTTFAKSTVSAFLQDYVKVTAASDKVNQAQEALNASMTAYDEILNPLKDHLKAIHDAQQDTADQTKIAQLNRIINATGITATKKRAAALELDEILTTRQIATLEDSKTAAQDAGQAKVDSANAGLDAAKLQLDLLTKQTQETLNLGGLLSQTVKQQQQVNDLVGERAKKLDAELDPLKKQLDAYKLQSEALKDHVREAQLKKILEDDTATAAQKAAAAYELQELAVRKQVRAVEAGRLAAEGYKVDLDAIEAIPVVLADIEGKGKTAKPVLDSVLKTFTGISDLDISQSLDDFGKTMDTTRGKINTFLAEFGKLLTKINDALPAFLSLKAAADGTIPGINALVTAFELFGAFFVGNKLLQYLQLIPTLLGQIFTKSNLILFAISLLATAWFNDWGGIQEKTKTAIEFIKSKFLELTGGGGLELVKTKLGEFFTTIKGYLTDPNTLVGQAVGTTTNFVSDFIAKHFSEESISAGLTTVKAKLSSFFATVQGYVNDPSSLGGDAATAATQAIGYLTKFANDHFNEQAVTDALAKITPILSGFFASIQGYFDDPATLGGQAATAVKQTVNALTKYANDNFHVQAVTDALALITPILSGFFADIQGYFDDPSTIGGQAATAVKLTVNALSKYATDNFNATAVTNALAQITPILSGFFASIQGYFDDPTTLGGQAAATVEAVSKALQKYIDTNFSQTNIDAALTQITGIATGFLTSVWAILNDDPTKKTAGDTTEGGQGTILKLFADKNFGPQAIADMLAFLATQWINTVSIIKDSLFKPLGDAIDKDDGKDTGTRIANFLIRGAGISVGALSEWVFGVGLPNLIFAFAGLVPFLFVTLPTWFHVGFGNLLTYFQTELFPALGAAGQSIIDGFLRGLDRFFDTTFGFPNFTERVSKGFYAFILTLESRALDFKTAGADLISGLNTGINDYWDQTLMPAVGKLWGTIVQSFKDFFGIASPSTLMHTEAGPIGEGLYNGIKDYITNTTNIASVVKGLGDLVSAMFSVDVLKKFTDAAFSLGSSIYDNISKGFHSLLQGGKDLLSGIFGGGDAATAAPKIDTAGASKAQQELIASFSGIASALKPEDVTNALNLIIQAFIDMRASIKGEIEGLDADTLAGLLQLQINLIPQLAALVAAFTKMAEDIRVAVATSITLMCSDTVTSITGLGTTLGPIVDGIVSGITAKFVKLRKDVMTEVNGLVSDIKGAFNDLGDKILGIVDQFKKDFVQIFKDMRSETLTEINGLVSDILTALTGTDGLLAKLKTDFVDKGTAIGKDFATNIAAGIKNGTDSVVSAASALGDAVIAKAKQKAKELADATTPSDQSPGSTPPKVPPGQQQPVASRGTLIESLLGQSIANASNLVNQRVGTNQSTQGNVVYNTTNIYQLNVTSNQQSRGLARDFGIMQVMDA